MELFVKNALTFGKNDKSQCIFYEQLHDYNVFFYYTFCCLIFYFNNQ